jgi:hypothetical protein
VSLQSRRTDSKEGIGSSLPARYVYNCRAVMSLITQLPLVVSLMLPSSVQCITIGTWALLSQTSSSKAVVFVLACFFKSCDGIFGFFLVTATLAFDISSLVEFIPVLHQKLIVRMFWNLSACLINLNIRMKYINFNSVKHY